MGTQWRRIIVRPSGAEPVIRVMEKADNRALVDSVPGAVFAMRSPQAARAVATTSKGFGNPLFATTSFSSGQ
jgi:hypothetical protein